MIGFAAGIEKENLLALESELLPFTVEDALRMQPFESLNLIKYEGGYSKIISKLPNPLI